MYEWPPRFRVAGTYVSPVRTIPSPYGGAIGEPEAQLTRFEAKTMRIVMQKPDKATDARQNASQMAENVMLTRADRSEDLAVGEIVRIGCHTETI